MWRTHAPTFNKWQKNKKEEEEEDTSHVDRWLLNVRVWVDLLDGLH
jgi:hypothetical protein